MSIGRRSKIVPIERFQQSAFRDSLGQIAMAKGVFDLTHAAHVESLRLAKEFGDSLVVALASDASVRARKGPGRPILTLDERVAVLSGLADVSHIVEYDSPSPFGVVRAVRPHFLCASHSDSMTQTELDEIVLQGTHLQILERPSGRSTSDILAAIHSTWVERR